MNPGTGIGVGVGLGVAVGTRVGVFVGVGVGAGVGVAVGSAQVATRDLSLSMAIDKGFDLESDAATFPAQATNAVSQDTETTTVLPLGYIWSGLSGINRMLPSRSGLTTASNR